jgi:hypothetical protein
MRGNRSRSASARAFAPTPKRLFQKDIAVQADGLPEGPSGPRDPHRPGEGSAPADGVRAAVHGTEIAHRGKRREFYRFGSSSRNTFR